MKYIALKIYDVIDQECVFKKTDYDTFNKLLSWQHGIYRKLFRSVCWKIRRNIRSLKEIEL